MTTPGFGADAQAEKAVVRAFHKALSGATPDTVDEVLNAHTAPDWQWRGMHPFNEQTGAGAVAETFWAPLLSSFTAQQRRSDIFLASRNEVDGFRSTWVLSMGHLMGLFDQPWLGIRPTGRVAMLRYAEFNRVENGKIIETAMFCDIPQLMMQAGQNPFPPQTGAHLVTPGPMTHDGLMWDAQPADQAQATWDAVMRMLKGEGRQYHHPDEARLLGEVWQDDMVWWGPGGIGATYTIPGYRKHHTGPFDDAFAHGGDAEKPDLCHLAEGRYGALFGYANMTVRNAGGFMGLPAGPHSADLRVVDIYRVAGGKIAENWVFIDLLHFLNMQGLDVLARNAAV